MADRGRGRGTGKERGGQDKKVQGKRKEDVSGRQKRVEQPYRPDDDQERKPGRSGETPPTRERRDGQGEILNKKEPYQNQQEVQGREEKRDQSTEVQSSGHKSNKCKEEEGEVWASEHPMAEQTLLTSQQSNQPQGGGKKRRRKKGKGTKKEEHVHVNQPIQENTARVKLGYAQGASNTSTQQSKTPEKDESRQSVTPLMPSGTPNTTQLEHTPKSSPTVVIKGDTPFYSACTPPNSTNTSPGDQNRKTADRLATSNPPMASKGLIIHVLMVHFLS